MLSPASCPQQQGYLHFVLLLSFQMGEGAGQADSARQHRLALGNTDGEEGEVLKATEVGRGKLL